MPEPLGCEPAPAPASPVQQTDKRRKWFLPESASDSTDGPTCEADGKPEGSWRVVDDVVAVTKLRLTNGDGKVLLEDARMRIAPGRAYGLVGVECEGMSALMRAISSRDPNTPFSGVPESTRIVHVGQQQLLLGGTAEGDDDRTPLQTLLSEVETLKEAGLPHKAVPERALRILEGLGFSEEESRTKPVRELGRVWRTRLALAHSLFVLPDLLILEEPTSALDIETTFWLEAYLAKWKKSLILMSSDACFLAAVCTGILHFHDRTLTSRGSFPDKDSKDKSCIARRHELLKALIFRCGCRCYCDTGAVPLHAVPAVPVVRRLSFPDPGALSLPMVRVQEVSFGYDPAMPLLFERVDFGLYLDSRICLLGPSGTGRSTLLKLISGELRERGGFIERNQRLVVARLDQNVEDRFPDPELSAVAHLRSRYPKVSDSDIMRCLGSFGVKGLDASRRTVRTLSPGQRTRVALAGLCLTSPHLLLLDEPADNLDIETVESLIAALNSFKGGLVLSTHNQRLIESCCNDLWVVGDKTLTARVDFSQYKQQVLHKQRDRAQEGRHVPDASTSVAVPVEKSN